MAETPVVPPPRVPEASPEDFPDLTAKLENWANHFKNVSTDEDEEFFEAWKSNIGQLKSLHEEHVDVLDDSPVEQAQARQMMVKAMRKVVFGGPVDAGDASMSGVETTGAEVSSKKRAAEEDDSFEDGVATDSKRGFKGLGGFSVIESDHSTDPKFIASLSTVVEADSKAVVYRLGHRFKNWGLTVNNLPVVIFEPKTRTGVQNIILWASIKNLRVRASGYRHTWTDMYSEDDQVLISMIPCEIAENVCVFHQPPLIPIQDGLSFIEVLKDKSNDGKTLCKIGASTTNDQFRKWCTTDNGGNWAYTLPLNVIMVEITFGGSNSPICHGAGIKHETLSDLVWEIEFVNPLGKIQCVRDPIQLKAAAGAFGLLGIVTSVTLRLDDMEYALLQPTQTDAMVSIPPPPGFTVPKKLQKNYTPAEVAQHVKDFEAHCSDDYYAEWFWFCLKKKTWNNCWKTAQGDPKELRKKAKLLSNTKIFEQSFLGVIAEVFNGPLSVSPWLQTKMMTFGAMFTLPDEKEPQITPVIEALHFRRGIHNMRVVDMELEIEIPSDEAGKPDWMICRRAWWEVIKLVYDYEAKKKYPMRLALEMRVMAGSSILMAPQFGNTENGSHGTCSIEVLSAIQVKPADWQEFMQRVSDIWHNLTDFNGRKLMVRSHWAKQWQSLRLGPNKIHAIDYYRDHVYAERIPEFKAQIQAIAEANGYDLNALQKRFSTPLLDQLFFTPIALSN
jgi:hypothetical protein